MRVGCLGTEIDDTIELCDTIDNKTTISINKRT